MTNAAASNALSFLFDQSLENRDRTSAFFFILRKKSALIEKKCSKNWRKLKV